MSSKDTSDGYRYMDGLPVLLPYTVVHQYPLYAKKNQDAAAPHRYTLTNEHHSSPSPKSFQGAKHGGARWGGHTGTASRHREANGPTGTQEQDGVVSSISTITCFPSAIAVPARSP